MKIDNKTKALGLLLIYAIVINILVFYAPITFFSPPNVSAINDVQFNTSDANSLESLVNTNWQAIALPDSWYENHSKIDQIWYRVDISLDSISDEPWGIYLPNVTHNAAVYINNVWVGQGGPFSEPVSRHHNEPLLFKFSPKLLQQGQNQIDIRVKTAFWEQGLLDQFYIAPMEQLQQAYFWKHFIRVDLIRWITISMFIMSLVVFSFWVARPQDAIYGLFTLELIFWATHNLNLLVSNIPVSTRVWEAMVMSTLGWTVVAMIFFNHRYVGYKNDWIEKMVLVFAILGLAIFFLPDVGSILHIGYKVWDVFVLIFGCYAVLFLVKTYLQKQDQDIYLMLFAGVPILAFGLHDILLINHYIDQRDGMIMHYGLIVAILLFSWFLIRRFVQAINKAETLAATLEQRVQNKQYALQLQYEQLQALEKQQVLAGERERIMRDIHDGIGGQLVSIIGLLQEKRGSVFVKIREKVQGSLTDLRFVIDSLDPVLSDVTTLLGMMRLRLIDQLESSNIDLEWAVTELPILKNMSPSRSLHIMRIVQEAITNSIKHSGSNKMKLATGILEESQQIFIDVIDYGKGFEQEKVMNLNSRGITNMIYRAKQIEAELDISSNKDNTRIRLLLSY
jgi:signal transduction histidine kinase